MITIKKEISVEEFEPWCGARYTYDRILNENKVEEFDELAEEWFPDGLTETELNDWLWFDDRAIFEALGMAIEE